MVVNFSIMRQKLNNISLRQLQAVEEVAQQQSFVKAASRLDLTPSALSESVKSLEITLGARLFDRTTRSVQLTAVGREFIDLVRSVLGQLDRAVQVVGELQNLERGLVRCVGATSALSCLVAPCLAELWKRAPQVQVEMRASVDLESLKMLRSGEADFCVGALPDAPTDDIDHQQLVHDCFGLVAERSHPIVQAPKVDLRHVRHVPYIAFTTKTGTDALLARQKGIATEFMEPSARVDSTGSLAAVLQQGVAVGILPALAIHQMGLEDLKFCPFAPPFPERTLSIFRLRGRSLTPAAQALWNLVRTNSRRLKGIQGVRLAT